MIARHQFSVDIMFARSAQAIERLFDEPILNVRVPAELPRQRGVTRTQGAVEFAIKQAGGDARFAPGTFFGKLLLHPHNIPTLARAVNATSPKNSSFAARSLVINLFVE